MSDIFIFIEIPIVAIKRKETVEAPILKWLYAS